MNRAIAFTATLTAMLFTASCSTAEPSAAPAPSPTIASSSPTPSPTASAEDQFWTFVTTRTDYQESAKADGVSTGRSMCEVFDEGAKIGRSHADALAKLDDRTDPDTEWLIRGAATYLCPAHMAEVDAWYDADPEPDPDLDEPAVYKPRKADWQVKVKIREKQCFGSAGCNVTVKTTPKYVGTQGMPESGTIEVTYKLIGDESGSITRTFTVEGGQVSYTESASLSTSGSGVKVRAKVTDVEYSE